MIAVVGPTGSGKSDLAVSLALELDGEVINADSMQFYRGMDIGTAKITEAERRGVPHHLLDILDVTEEASVSDFQQQARALIADIHGRGKRAILAGGSGLYVRAALDVLEFPGTDPDIRGRLEAELATAGAAPAAGNGWRQWTPSPRAGSAMSAGSSAPWKSSSSPGGHSAPSCRPASTSSLPSRSDSRWTGNCSGSAWPDRVHAMVDQGLLDEVRRLDAAGLRNGRTAPRALGYAQFLRVLDGDSSVEQAADETIVATRQFARRQLTWFRADPRVTWLGWHDPDLVAKAAGLCRATPVLPPA